MDDIMDPPNSDGRTSATATIIETPSQANLRLTRQFRKKLRKFAVLLFSLLIIFSLAYFISVLVFWQIWPKIGGLTNMYSGFFGFASATVLNIIASIAGIATFHDNGSRLMDPVRSTAVCMLLAASIMFNIVFPMSALLPFEGDSRKRVLTIPLLDCVDLKHDLKGIPVPECDHSDDIILFLYITFPLILLEVIVLIAYGYLKTIQCGDPSGADYSTLSSSQTKEESNGDDVTFDTGDRSMAVDALDTYTTVVPQSDQPRFGTGVNLSVNRRGSYGGDQFYWAPPDSVVTSQSTPFRTNGSRSRSRSAQDQDLFQYQL